MDKKDLKKVLAGLSLTALLAGTGLAGCANNGASPPPPSEQHSGGSG